MDGTFSWDGHTTWYDASGTTEEGKLPIVILHGGPGATHDYLEDLAVLSRSGRQTILYDQIGCGNSEHLPAARASFWTTGLFKRELTGLLEHLGIDDAYTLLGQSWGGMLAMEHALDHPEGLKGMVVSNSPASIPLWVEEANRLRKGLPPEVQEVLLHHEAAGTTDDPAYEAAVTVFYERHLCRVPWPECMVRAFALMDEDPTVYHTMNGPSEFHCIGSLKDWDITDRLPRDRRSHPADLGRVRRSDAPGRQGHRRPDPRLGVGLVRGCEPLDPYRGTGEVRRCGRAVPRPDRSIGTATDAVVLDSARAFPSHILVTIEAWT